MSFFFTKPIPDIPHIPTACVHVSSYFAFFYFHTLYMQEAKALARLCISTDLYEALLLADAIITGLVS